MRARILIARYGLAALVALLALVPWLAFGANAEAVTLILLLAAVILGSAFLLGRARRRLQGQGQLISAVTGDPDKGLFALDGRHQISYANVAAERMLGWTADELRGRNVIAIFRRADGRDGEDMLLRSLSATDRLYLLERSGEEVFVRRDGSSFPVTCSLTPMVTDGKSGGWLLSFRDASEQKQAEGALRSSEERYRRLVDTLPQAVVLTDPQGRILMANPRAALLYGFERHQAMVGANMLDLLEDGEIERARQAMQAALSGEPAEDVEYVGRRKDGSRFAVELALSAPTAQTESARSVIIMGRDLTERRQAEATQRLGEARRGMQHAAVAALAGASTVGDAVTGLLEVVGQSEGWNFGAYWRLSEDDGSMKCDAVWHASPGSTMEMEELAFRVSLAPQMDLPGRVLESRAPLWVEDVLKDGSFSRALVASRAGLRTAVCVPIALRGRVHSVLELFSVEIRPPDPDFIELLASIGTQLAQFLERKDAERALHYQATHDALTDLPNRSLLHRRLQNALRAARPDGGALSLLLLDLDRFKEVNDSLGHHFGDLLLQQVAARLQCAVRESDTVARLGGDEFAVLLPATDIDGAQVVAGSILGALAQPVTLPGHRLDVWTSIGIVAYPEHGRDPDILMQRADVAMYAAKRAKSGTAVYRPDQDTHSAGRLAIISELREAIDAGELILHYQPKINFRTGRIDGVEALVRWRHARRGLVPPDEFIPLAEQTGLIAPLTTWVLTAAMRQCRRWQEEGLGVRVAVNLSAQSLHDTALPDLVSAVLRTERVEARHLEIEITESAIMVDSVRALETLHLLHDMGVRLTIDDFGTGYSSLSYLKQLPVHEIKIDKSFVLDMQESESDSVIAKSVIDLGHNLGLEVTAEGVQSQESWNRLTEMQCDVGQGHHAGRPVPAEELTPWLRAVLRATARQMPLEQTGT